MTVRKIMRYAVLAETEDEAKIAAERAADGGGAPATRFLDKSTEAVEIEQVTDV